MCINTEWGGFGDDGGMDFARTKYDRILDENSVSEVTSYRLSFGQFCST